MKTENECLFSIKLQNGLVITGSDPYTVQHFMLDLKLASHDSMMYSSQQVEQSSWVDLMRDYETMFHDAWFTIYKNTKHEED